MRLLSKRVDIFEGPNSNLERTKHLNAKGKGQSTIEKQITPLNRTKTKMHYNTCPQGISKQTKSRQKVLSGGKQKQSTLKNGKPNSGNYDKPRRSTRLEAQRSKDVIST